MRQLKFRAYHNKAEKMLESGTARQIFSWLDEGQDITIMQFTGLLDKNGKEIYEGDLVIKTVKDYGRPETSPFLVNWNHHKAGFNISAGAKDDPKHWYEVIGNIYEHPHLLNSTPNHEGSDTTKGAST